MPTAELPPLEGPSPEVLALITEAKADFIEAEANKMYDFFLESREILTREAHTTLQWLFAIIIGASGYLMTLLAKQFEPQPPKLSETWWVIVPLAMAAAASSFEAFRLINNALRATKVYPRGNSAQILTEDGFATHTAVEMRFLEAWLLQGRILPLRERNKSVGAAINRARTAVVVIPVTSLLVLVAHLVLAWTNNLLSGA